MPTLSLQRWPYWIYIQFIVNAFWSKYVVELQCCDLTRVKSRYIIHICYRNLSWLRGSTEIFLKTVCVKADTGNFKNVAIFHKNVTLHILSFPFLCARHKNAHAYYRCIPRNDHKIILCKILDSLISELRWNRTIDHRLLCSFISRPNLLFF